MLVAIGSFITSLSLAGCGSAAASWAWPSMGWPRQETRTTNDSHAAGFRIFTASPAFGKKWIDACEERPMRGARTFAALCNGTGGAGRNYFCATCFDAARMIQHAFV